MSALRDGSLKLPGWEVVEPSKAEQTWMAVITDVTLRQYITNFVNEHGYTRPDDVLQAIAADCFPTRSPILAWKPYAHQWWPLDAYTTAPYRLQCISTVMESIRASGMFSTKKIDGKSYYFVPCGERQNGPCLYVSPRASVCDACAEDKL